ncbi:MAG: hypothetical protein Q7J60_23110 [Bradyrhizobium sp.]|uniref:hypothetical protein n=1 Tax=Bradyrhizobium sp. TaxID=376 RepID=UPI002729015C|nr:hypothetical protein [Bradyrhizobium sp.]MDO9564522.1 hypothetical protein [Bradyrhizobium sp.]MDP3690687.1 hypothetical protein [Bradyrhizobium sp.]
MNKFLKYAAALLVLLTASEAFARGGAAASIMSSPGYQRRLQESRGYVPNQSGSVLPTRPARVHPPKKRHRH